MTILHLLAHHPHLLHWFSLHQLDIHRFMHIARHHPHRMHYLLAQRHYCHWLLRFITTRDGLPPTDQILGA